MPRFSIIMPVYNTGSILINTINSILSQSYTNFELLLIDDGSTDQSSGICDNYARLDTRVKAFHKVNGGICDARNYGLAHAIGDYIGFCDHDDEYNKDLLKIVDQCITSDNADVIKYNYKSEFDSGKSFTLQPIASDNLTVKDVDSLLIELISKNYFSTVWSFFYRRELIIKSSVLFSTEYKHGGEDFDFNIRIFYYVTSLTVIPQTLYYHFVRGSLSTSAKVYRDSYFLVNKELESINALLDAKNVHANSDSISYSGILITKIKYATAYGIKANVSYQDIVKELDHLKKHDKMSVPFKSDSEINILLFKCFKHRFYLLIYLIARLKHVISKRPI